MRLDELCSFRRDVAATFPGLAERYAGDLIATHVPQPWFARHQLLRLEVINATGLRLIGTRGDGKLAVLSGRLDRFDELVTREPPRGITEDNVVAYAEDCDAWTSPYDILPTSIHSLNDLHWISTRACDLERLTRMVEGVGNQLSPPKVTHSGADTIVTRAVLCGRRLIRRRLTIRRNGALRRDDVVLAERLPIAPLPY